MPKLGMWSWRSSHFQTAKGRKGLIDFCLKEGISHIDQHVAIKNGVVLHGDDLRTFIAEATKQKITVNALRGSKKMFFENNHEKTLADVKAIVNFNKISPSPARFLGVKFDVEPYGTDEWKAGGVQRKKVILDYLLFLKKAKTYLEEEAASLQLATDIPFWWDKKEFEVEFSGKRQLFVQHILDSIDWVGIMSYRRDSKATLRLVHDEHSYAKLCRYDAAIGVSMETTNNLSDKEAHIGFWGTPTEQFRRAIKVLRERLSGESEIRCIMLHHYDSLRLYLQVD